MDNKHLLSQMMDRIYDGDQSSQTPWINNSGHLGSRSDHCFQPNRYVGGYRMCASSDDGNEGLQ